MLTINAKVRLAKCYTGPFRVLHTFPTRRSSDLLAHNLGNLLNRSSDLLAHNLGNLLYRSRSEERFSRNAETDVVCRVLLEKKDEKDWHTYANPVGLEDMEDAKNVVSITSRNKL